jgi:predicted molibdopterin-dependent oxidoreductase YjgC
MMNVIITEGWADEQFIADRCENYEDLWTVLESYTPEVAARITGVPVEKIRQAAEIYARTPRAGIFYTLGITEHTTGTANVMNLANLAMVTGHVGTPHSGVNPLRGQNNVQGACDMGALPNVYSGYRNVTVPEHAAFFEDAWGVPLDRDLGLRIPEMFDAAHAGELKAMYIMGEDPILTDPDTNHVRGAISALEFLVVQDIFMTETAKYADVVLPAGSYAEKDGTFTNTERRCQRVRKAVDPPGQARADWRILVELARAMGQDWNYPGPEAVFREMAGLTPSYAGMDYGRLGLAGLQWPCPDSGHPGTPVLHTAGFPRGRALLAPAGHTPAAEEPDDDFPFVLSTGRTYAHFHTATMTGNSPHLAAEGGEGFVEINPDDGAALGVGPGDAVRLTTRRGRVAVRARLTVAVPRGMVFLPFHFPASPANELTNTVLDPTSRIPELKRCAVRVDRI